MLNFIQWSCWKFPRRRFTFHSILEVRNWDSVCTLSSPTLTRCRMKVYFEDVPDESKLRNELSEEFHNVDVQLAKAVAGGICTFAVTGQKYGKVRSIYRYSHVTSKPITVALLVDYPKALDVASFVPNGIDFDTPFFLTRRTRCHQGHMLSKKRHGPFYCDCSLEGHCKGTSQILNFMDRQREQHHYLLKHIIFDDIGVYKLFKRIEQLSGVHLSEVIYTIYRSDLIRAVKNN